MGKTERKGEKKPRVIFSLRIFQGPLGSVLWGRKRDCRCVDVCLPVFLSYTCCWYSSETGGKMLFLLPPLFSFAFLILKRRRRRTGPFLLFLHILVLILFGLRLQGREKRTRRRGKLGKRIFAPHPSPSSFSLLPHFSWGSKLAWTMVGLFFLFWYVGHVGFSRREAQETDIHSRGTHR